MIAIGSLKDQRTDGGTGESVWVIWTTKDINK